MGYRWGCIGAENVDILSCDFFEFRLNFVPRLVRISERIHDQTCADSSVVCADFVDTRRN